MMELGKVNMFIRRVVEAGIAWPVSQDVLTPDRTNDIHVGRARLTLETWLTTSGTKS